MDKTPQHIQVPHDLGVSEKVKMNPTDYLVYGYLRKYMDKDSFQTFVSLRKLAELADISINTVQSSIKKLIKSGDVKLLSKQGRSNVYEIQKNGRYFERFTYEFLDANNLDPEEKGVLLAMQQYTNKSDGKYAITTKSNEELASKMHMGTRSLQKVFRSLEEKGIMMTDNTPAIDRVTGIRKTAKYVDLALICQAILFVNQKVDEHTNQIEMHENKLGQHSEEIKNLQKENIRLKKEIEKIMKAVSVNEPEYKLN